MVYGFDSTSMAATYPKAGDRHNLKSNAIPFDTTSRIVGKSPARLLETAPASCTKCRQYRRRLESIATVRIMIADPLLEVCVPRYLSRTVKRSAAD